MKKKILAIFLAVVMIVSGLPVSVFAIDESTAKTFVWRGQTFTYEGAELTWSDPEKPGDDSSEPILTYTNCEEEAVNTFTTPIGVAARVLAVGGGGGGGGAYKVGFSGNYGGGGGGGAGGFIDKLDSFAAATYTITVGAGGKGGAKVTSSSADCNGEDGKNTTLSTADGAIITAYGGGGGGSQKVGNSGASGGGGSMKSTGATENAGGTGTEGQGTNGGKGDKGMYGGGGGGAGAAGADASTENPIGGDGLKSDITGTEKWYAGGGGGSHSDKSITTPTARIEGGKGGGGKGGVGKGSGEAAMPATDGENGTGGGGGGCDAATTGTGGNGGSGVVVIRVTALAEPDTTIADILPEDFPLCVDVLPENVWTNENGLYLMLVDTCLVLTSEDQGDYVLAGDVTTAVLTKDENNYKYTNDGVTTTFVMADNALLNIAVAGLTDEFVNFNGTYAAPIAYTITDGTAEDAHGSISFDKTSVFAEDKVTITVKADKGYKLVEDSLKVYKTNKSGPRVEPIIPVQDEQDDTKYTFVMPAFDVTVTAEFEEIPINYTITNGTPQGDAAKNNGYITIEKTSAAEGETVTITVNPDEGYQLKSLTVVPATPTTYTVTFATAEHGAIYDAATSGQKVTSISVDGGTAVAVEGNKITIGDKNYYAIANSGYKFNGFENAPAAITEATTVTPVFEADTLTDGYYMIYITDDTTINNTNSSMKLEADEYVPGQYKLDWTFNQGDAIKVVKVENNAIAAWYPDGLWNEYTIPAAEAGERTLLFKPEYTEEWNSWGGYVTIKPKTASKSLNSPAPAELETITPAKQDDGTYQFTMPAYDVTVTAEFEEIPTYAITNGTAEDAHGSISFDKTSVFAEDKVTITVKADKGYKLVEDSLKVYKTNKSGPRVEPIIPVQDEQDNTKYTFVMPAFDVTVTAEFEKTEWQKLADAMSGKEQGTVDGVFEVDDTTTPGTRIITLLTDIKADNAVDSALVVPTACKVVLDLNGHILDRGLSEKTENGHVIKVEYGGELTLRDSDPTADNGEYKGGVITGGNTKKTGGGIWVNGGKLIMEGGTIANNYALNQNGGGVAVCENVRYSGGVIIDKGVFVMKGGVIRDNYAYVGGGVSALAESEIELIGGTITNNRALSKAGGVYAGSAKTVCKIGGSIKITGNYCSYVLIGATRYMPEGFDDVNANTTEQNLYLSYINKENYAKISISEVAPTTMDVKFTEEHTVSEGETLTIIESLPEEFKASILQYLQMENTENEECYVNEEGKTVIHIPVYLVNIADVTGGSVTADVSFFEVKSFEPDTKTVELTVVPDEGYLFKSLKVTYIDGTEKTVILEQNEQDNTKYTFVMPAFDVTVTAEFEEIKDSGVWFDYCTEQAEYDTSIGAGGNMYWGIRIPKAELQKLSLPVLEKIAFYEFEYTGTHTLFIFQPNANSLPALDSYIHSQQITVNGINDWHEVILTTPITVDVDKDLWIILYDEDMVYPGAGSAYTGDLNGTLANVEGEWVSIIDYGFYYTWMLRGYFSVTPQYTVSGTVTSFGSETDDITIQLIKNGETDAAYETTVNGNTATYNIEKVLDGDYTLKVTKKGHATRTYDVTVSGAPVELDLEIRHLGDLNGDGRTNKSDMSLLKDHINKTELLIGYDENVGDLNNDGDVGKADLAVLKNHINRIELLY